MRKSLVPLQGPAEPWPVSAHSFLGDELCVSTLDLSYNGIRKIENISRLINVQKLFLSCNKITKIEGLDSLKMITMLELGANRIRVR